MLRAESTGPSWSSLKKRLLVALFLALLAAQGHEGLGRGSGAEGLALVGAVPAPGGAHFLLARHGQTTWNAEKRFQGSVNEGPVLTEKGLQQARELGGWLRDLATPSAPAVKAVFVSPLIRARQTLAEAEAAAGPGVLPDSAAVMFPELREIDLHEWEGRKQAEIAESEPETLRLWKERAWELRLGGGRPVIQDLWDRAAVAWKLMQEAAPSGQKPSLVVAHGTLGKALLSTALGMPIQAFRHFELGNGEVVEVAWPPGTSSSGAIWRRRHPEEGPWRSLADEEAVPTELPQGVDIA